MKDIKVLKKTTENSTNQLMEILGELFNDAVSNPERKNLFSFSSHKIHTIQKKEILFEHFFIPENDLWVTIIHNQFFFEALAKCYHGVGTT